MPDMIDNSYMAHGYCLLWKPWLVGLHGVSDILIALSYFAIPFAIFIFVRRRPNLEMKNLAWMFVAFITLCGVTHIVGLVTLWTPIYETEGWIKGATAVVSVVTAVAIFPLIPKALAIPSPTELQLVNTRLNEEIAAHKKTLIELEAARAELEKRVEARTLELNESQAFLKRITDIAPTMLYVYDVEPDRLDWMNRAFETMVGYSMDELNGESVDRRALLVHPDDQDAYTRHRERRRALSEDEVVEVEYRLKSHDGSWRWVLVNEMAYQLTGTGTVKQVIGAAHDITDRKEQEHRIQLLMGEVNHRAKNLLTVVQSVARQTAKSSRPEEFAEDLSNRLRGLAASQDLIIQGEWQGVDLGALVRLQLGYLDSEIGTRLKLSGPDIILSPSAAQGIGMALHELATNALKYGALTTDSGEVSVEWRRDTDADGVSRFVIDWIESGGPPVLEPDNNGFGRTVIERMAAQSVGGEVELRYDSDGVKWKLMAPYEKVHNKS